MSGNVSVCDIDPSLIEKVKKFNMRKDKNIAAIVMKVLPDKLLVVEDEMHEDISIEELVAELPEHVPRYVALSYVLNHSDGRVSYPLCFIFISPDGVKTDLHMMYAGSKLEVANTLKIGKVCAIRDLEELTDEWLVSQLKR